jgi:DNA-binding MarR family transcriptional regulator
MHVQITLRLASDGSLGIGQSPAGDRLQKVPSHEELSDLGARIYQARRTRDRMLGGELFGEPAWDMLLALYCLPSEGERLSVTGLTYAAELPQTTGYRWQTILMERGLIERVPDLGDARRLYVILTDNGRKLLDNYLTRLFNCGSVVP